MIISTEKLYVYCHTDFTLPLVKKRKMATYILKCFHHTKLQEPTLSGTSVSPTSEVHTSYHVGIRDGRKLKSTMARWLLVA
jgi:hypothetical protein